MNVHLQWHLTIPPSSPVILGNPGMSAVLVFKSNTLFFYVSHAIHMTFSIIFAVLQLQFSRHSPHGVEIQSTVVPFLYDMANRTLKLPQPKDSPPFLPNTFLGMVNSILQRFYEYPQGMFSTSCADGVIRSHFLFDIQADVLSFLPSGKSWRQLIKKCLNKNGRNVNHVVINDCNYDV